MNGPTLNSNLSLLSDDDLTRAVTRAWREAARCWADYRAYSGGEAAGMLLTSAEAADDWWQTLLEEQERRITEVPTEVPSADRYRVEPIAADRSAPESPWVTRAKAGRLAPKDLTR